MALLKKPGFLPFFKKKPDPLPKNQLPRVRAKITERFLLLAADGNARSNYRADCGGKDASDERIAVVQVLSSTSRAAGGAFRPTCDLLGRLRGRRSCSTDGIRPGTAFLPKRVGQIIQPLAEAALVLVRLGLAHQEARAMDVAAALIRHRILAVAHLER